MQVSSGRPHRLTSNQRGRGNEPVTVLGRIRSAVAVNMRFLQPAFYFHAVRLERSRHSVTECRRGRGRRPRQGGQGEEKRWSVRGPKAIMGGTPLLPYNAQSY